MAVMVSAIANGGAVLRPRLVDRIEPQDLSSGEETTNYPAGMVRDRAISPVELVESHLSQIAARNPHINAFAMVFEEQARAAARLAEAAVMHDECLGLLHGVPVTVKDSFDIAGQPTLCGSRFRLGHQAAQDATAVARLRAVGAIILGKTNLSEWANFRSSHSSSGWSGRGGQTRNPYALDRNPCGSSSGSGAATSANLCAAAVGSETDGSIVCPSSANGIVGIKPTV